MNLKFITGPTLYEVILEWWQTADACRSSDSLAYELASKVGNWLPPEQTYSGSQLPAECEWEIDGYNEALKTIRSKLKPPAYSPSND